MAVVHREGSSGREEGLAVQAVKELVGVLKAVVPDAQIKLFEVTFPDERALSVGLHKNAFGCDANTTKLLSRTGKSGIAVAANFQ